MSVLNLNGSEKETNNVLESQKIVFKKIHSKILQKMDYSMRLKIMIPKILKNVKKIFTNTLILQNKNI